MLSLDRAESTMKINDRHADRADGEGSHVGITVMLLMKIPEKINVHCRRCFGMSFSSWKKNPFASLANICFFFLFFLINFQFSHWMTLDARMNSLFDVGRSTKAESHSMFTNFHPSLLCWHSNQLARMNVEYFAVVCQFPLKCLLKFIPSSKALYRQALDEVFRSVSIDLLWILIIRRKSIGWQRKKRTKCSSTDGFWSLCRISTS